MMALMRKKQAAAKIAAAAAPAANGAAKAPGSGTSTLQALTNFYNSVDPGMLGHSGLSAGLRSAHLCRAWHRAPAESRRQQSPLALVLRRPP